MDLVLQLLLFSVNFSDVFFQFRNRVFCLKIVLFKDIQGFIICLLYTSDAADERSSVDLGGRRIIKQKNKKKKNTRTIRSRNGAAL